MRRTEALAHVARYCTWTEIGATGWMRVPSSSAARLRAEGILVRGTGELWYAKLTRADLTAHIDNSFVFATPAQFAE